MGDDEKSWTTSIDNEEEEVVIFEQESGKDVHEPNDFDSQIDGDETHSGIDNRRNNVKNY